MEKLATKLSKILVLWNVIEDEDSDFYRYAIESLLLYLINFSSFLFIAGLNGKILECIIFIMLFYPLRTYGGGMHMKTWFSCFVASNIIIVAVTYIFIEMNVEKIYLPVMIVFLFIVFMFAPCEDIKHKIEGEKIIKCKKIVRIYSICIVLIGAGLLATGLTDIFRLCMAAMIVSSFTILMGTINKRLNMRNNENV